MSETQDVATQIQRSYISFLPHGSTRIMEFLAEMQKFSLNLYARQTTAALDSFRSMFPMVPASLIDSAQLGISELSQMQMRAVDSIVSRGKEYLEGGEGRSTSENYGQISAILGETANQFLMIHAKLVQIFMQQVQNFAASMLPGPPSTLQPAFLGTDMIQRNTEIFVEAQKKFWGFFLRA